VRLLPPLIINDAESAELVERLGGLIQKFLQAR
jgi:acetylornithine/succinyldiaminopimelate/putrescine aminotransferase